MGEDLDEGGEVVSVNVSTVGAPIPVDNTPPIISILIRLKIKCILIRYL